MRPRLFPLFVQKMRQALTFLATIENDDHGMPWGTIAMLSVDQFLRLISLPAVVAAFLIASQISGGVISHPAQVQMASE
jgi:hypothetical protein